MMYFSFLSRVSRYIEGLLKCQIVHHWLVKKIAAGFDLLKLSTKTPTQKKVKKIVYWNQANLSIFNVTPGWSLQIQIDRR